MLTNFRIYFLCFFLLGSFLVNGQTVEILQADVKKGLKALKSNNPSAAITIGEAIWKSASHRYRQTSDKRYKDLMGWAHHIQGRGLIRNDLMRNNSAGISKLEKSINQAKEVNNNALLAANYGILLGIYSSQNNSKKSRYYFKKIAEISERPFTNSKISSGSSSPAPSQSNSNTSAADKRKISSLESDKKSLNNQLTDALKKNNSLKSDMNKLRQQVLTLQVQSGKIQDSERLKAEELINASAEELEATKKNLSKKINKIEAEKGTALSQKKKLQEEVKKTTSELTAQEAENEAQREAYLKQAAVGVGGLIILGLLAILFWTRYRLKRKANEQLQQQNDEIQKQRDEIFQQKESLTKQTEEIIIQRDKITKQRDEITIQKAEQEKILDHLKSTQSQLIQSEKMASLGQLTAGIAHEINNPINFVSGNINPLRRDIEDISQLFDKVQDLEEAKDLPKSVKELLDLAEELDADFLFQEITELMNGIQEGALRTKDIVAGLRTFSRADEDNFKLVNVNDGLNSTLMLLHNNYKDRVTIHKNYGELPEIECLPGKLNQVFMNILNNAGQAIEGKGDIWVSSKKVGNHIRISIQDSGRGMPEHVKNRIFEPFFTTKDVGEGTGLGLSISFGIIEKHNGSMEVFSEPGKGTEFVITLPLQQIKNEDK